MSRRGQIMLGYLRRELYSDSPRMLELLDTQGIELDGVWFTLDDILDQCFVDRATWGLGIWEEELQLNSEPMDGYEVRRARIKAKLIGFGSFTEAVARELANTFSRSGNAKFIPMYSEYSFKTQYADDDLISYKGLKAAFEQVKPAHLRHLIGLLIGIHNKHKMRTLLRLRTRVNFFGGYPWFLDGIEHLNGHAALSGWAGNRPRFNDRMVLRSKHRNTNNQDAIIRQRQNYWLLDGSQLLDGRRTLSSTETIITF